jgi:hypothetical protein
VKRAATRDIAQPARPRRSSRWASPCRPASTVDARLKITTEAEANDRGTSREIMIKQAELEQSNVHHALDASIQLEGQLISYSNQVEQRVFDSCKYATEAGISIYNARVQAYAAFVDAFKARIAIYEATIRGELAKVEAYKAQMEAEIDQGGSEPRARRELQGAGRRRAQQRRGVQGAHRRDPGEGRDREGEDRDLRRAGEGLRRARQRVHRRRRGLPCDDPGRGDQAGRVQVEGRDLQRPGGGGDLS